MPNACYTLRMIGALLAALLFGQDLRLDASFAQNTIRYLRTGDAAILRQLAGSPAAIHLLNHARNFDAQLESYALEISGGRAAVGQPSGCAGLKRDLQK